MVVYSGASCAQESLSVGQVSDKRFAEVRTMDTTYDLKRLSNYKTPQAWARRARELRERLLACAGLLPAPRKTPLKAHIFGKTDCGGYTVEKVYFESYPRFCVTGNLYRPKGSGPFPAVLNPHGHWKEGRLANEERGSVPGRCINFAKQGYVAFNYDMIGYNDSKQVPHTFASDRAKLWGISLCGLQLHNSIRALDFLQSLPNVDRGRIACTGASGGGTQTYMLAAVDDRVKVSAPVVMVSAHFQGGCICENAPNMRIEANNVELAAVAAPRPQLLVAATGDWTLNTLEVELPAIKGVYKLFGAAGKAAAVRFDAPHNYNKDSREAVYSWFARWLPRKPRKGEVTESAFEVLPEADLRVFPDELPPGGLDQDSLTSYLIGSAKSDLEAHQPTDASSLKRLRRVYLPLLRGALMPPVRPKVTAEGRGALDGDGFQVTKLVLQDADRGAQIPALLLAPSGQSAGRAALVVHEKGKSALLDGREPRALVRRLLDEGFLVLAVDCFGTGEHTAPSDAPRYGPDIAHFDTYNRTDTAERVYDILLALAYLQGQRDVSQLSMVGMGQAGLWCLLARPFAPALESVAADTAGFDTSDDESFVAKLYVPLFRRAGDFRTAIALCAPGRLLLHNTQGKFDTSWACAAYAAAGKPGALRVFSHRSTQDAVARWLIAPR